MKNPTLVPTIDSFETICEENGMRPVVHSLNAMCEVVVKNEMCAKVPKEDLIDCKDLESSVLSNQ